MGLRETRASQSVLSDTVTSPPVDNSLVGPRETRASQSVFGVGGDLQKSVIHG